MRHRESQLQSACVKWFRLQYPDRVLFAIPNGGRRGKVEAAIMKGEGVLAGVADVFIMTSGNGVRGLFIEFKTETGRQSPEQKDFERKCYEWGYSYEIVRSFHDFKAAIGAV